MSWTGDDDQEARFVSGAVGEENDWFLRGKWTLASLELKSLGDWGLEEGGANWLAWGLLFSHGERRISIQHEFPLFSAGVFRAMGV